MKCNECKRDLKDVSEYYEEGEKALCRDCMDKLDLVWDRDSYEFVPRYVSCDNCGGEMSWCDCCGCYTQDCCVDFGTCACS